MNDDSQNRSSADTLPPPGKGSSFNTFQRSPKRPRVPSGRILPAAPAWMQKPLKPPGQRNPTDGR